MNTPLVSVFMPTYNYGQFIEQAITSVRQQSYKNFELIVSDNKSTDDTEEIVIGFAKQDSRIKYFQNDSNVGMSKNFNLAVERCNPKSEFLILLPADDWWQDNLLEELIESAHNNKDATVIYCDGIRTNADGVLINKYTDLCKVVPEKGLHKDLFKMLQNNYVPIQAALLRRKDLELLLNMSEFFDPTVPHVNDLRLWLQLMCNGNKFFFLDKALARVRKHPAANTSPEKLIPRLTQEVLVFEKTYPICPAKARGELVKQLANRHKRLAFLHFQAGQFSAAKTHLKKARKLFEKRHLDIFVAMTILRLPLPKQFRSSLWRAALSVANAGSS